MAESRKAKRVGNKLQIYLYLMKKVFILGVAFATVLGAVISCDKVKEAASAVQTAAEGGKEIDYQFLSKPEEVKKWLDEVRAKAGEHAKVMDEVKFYINRPALEGTIKREGEKDFLYVDIVYQDPEDKRRVEEINYFGNTSGWTQPEKKEINVVGIGAENFRLEDELFDFNQVTDETINKVLQDAWAKYKDEAKYEYQYIKGLKIDIEGIEATIHGKLKANGVEKTEYYKTDFQGNSKK